MWVTEFDWNGDLDEPDVPWDYEEYARILGDFYTVMFSQEVTQLYFVKIFIKHQSVLDQGCLRYSGLETNHL